MLEIENYLKTLIYALKKAYGNRLIYVGLQGSYCRGEYDDSSDIDIMVVLDNLFIEDMDVYKQLMFRLEYTGKSSVQLVNRISTIRVPWQFLNLNAATFS